MTGGVRATFFIVLSRFLVYVPAVALAGVIGALLLFPYYDDMIPGHPQKPLVDVAAPAQMRQAMAMLQEEHEALEQFLQRQQLAADAREASRAKERDIAREDALNEAHMKAAAASREAAEAKAPAQRRVVEASSKAPRRAEAKNESNRNRQDEELAAPGEPLAIVPAVAPRRGPIDKAIATAGEWKDKTLAAADTVREFFVAAADKLIGGIAGSAAPAGRLMSSSW